jgi:uncharacterized 2Fe-2S/4Fe-4S cluster protein (DUF4445 family)
VRAVQLAKAALCAGATLLIEKRGCDPPQRVTLVGAIGRQIDPVYAKALGFIPDCDLAKVDAGGNAAGAGACIALIDFFARAEIEAVVRAIDKVETAIDAKFHDEFVAAIALPHAGDSFENFAKAIQLPPRRGIETVRRRRRDSAY